MDATSIVVPLGGGALIGVAAAVLLVLSGRIAGVSGILGGLIRHRGGEWLWRGLFVAGLVAGGAVALAVRPGAFAVEASRSAPALLAAGLLVGFGSRLGSGCTSGHGVCGAGRLSPRSIAATGTFILTGVATVFVVRTFFGGSL
jgi:uncharacterized protein